MIFFMMLLKSVLDIEHFCINLGSSKGYCLKENPCSVRNWETISESLVARTIVGSRIMLTGSI